MKARFNKYYLLFILTGMLFVTGLDIFAAEPLRVAIAPFNIHSEKDLLFLQDGIYEMLALRVSSEGSAEVMGREKTESLFQKVKGGFTDEAVRETGADLGADVVIFGSLTVLENSVSLSAKMMDVKNDKPLLSLFDQCRGLDEVMPKIALFAEEAGKKLAETGISTGNTAHETLQTGQTAAPSGELSAIKPETVFFKVEEKAPLLKETWRSEDLKIVINGIALGDVDGDGKNEIIAITPHSVQLYRYDGNHFSAAEELAKDRYDYYIGVDVADINKNGFPEIFISGLTTQRDRINSYVLEYDGKNYHRIVNDSGWHYRGVNIPERGDILFGQKNESKEKDIFSGPIFEMEWKSGNYEPGNQVVPSGAANIMGFSMAGIMTNGPEAVLAYSRKNKVQIMDRTGEIHFTGNEDFGGSDRYISVPGHEPGSDIRRFFPTRLRAEDINADGTAEIVAIKNIEAFEGLRKNFRSFKGAEIQLLAWNGSDFSLMGKTAGGPIYISDVMTGDCDNDKKDELVAAVIIGNSGFSPWKKPVNALVVYEMGE